MRLIFFSFRNLSFILFLSFLLVYSERPVFAQNYFNYNPGVKKTFNSVLTLDTISRFISEAQVSEVWLNSIDINSDDLYGLLNRANDKIQEGYFYEALSDIEKAFIIDSTLSESFLLKGICLMNLGQPDSAEVELNNAIRIDNNNALAYNIRGRIRLISDQITLSENDFLHSLELDNSLGDSYYFLALIKISEYEYVKATKYLKRCIGLMPDFPEAYIALSNLYKLQHQPHASLKTISEGIERMPSNPVLLMVRGTTYLNDEDYKSASTDFNTVLEIEPMNFIGLLMRGTLYSIKQEYNSAYADFYNALKGDSKIGRNFVDSNVKKQVCAQTNISPNYFTYDSLRYGKYWSYYQRALCSYLINDYETSLRNLNIILVDEPQFYQPYELRAAIHRIKRNPRKAADDIEKSFEIRGDSSIHDIMNLALLYYWIKDYPKASKYLTLAITHEPDNPDLYYYLARINFYQNNLEASISYYEKVLFYLPDYQDVLFQLAQAKNQLGNYEEALEDYYKVLEKDSSNLELTLIIAEVLNKLKLYNETISLLNKYLKLDQGNLDVYVYLGDTYSLLEDYENALIYYSKVEQALSGNFDVIYSVAKTHLYLGDTLSAKQIIERELENQMAYHYKHNRGISTLHYYLSDCYSSPNEKINQLSKAIKFHESSVYYFNRGYFYSIDGLQKKALKDFKKANELEANNYFILMCMANSYKEAGDYSEAKKKYIDASRVPQKKNRAIRELGIMEVETGNIIKGIDDLKNALKLDSTDCKAHFYYITYLAEHDNISEFENTIQEFLENPCEELNFNIEIMVQKLESFRINDKKINDKIDQMISFARNNSSNRKAIFYE